MGKLFIFCIGGTGSRVLRALTFLLASGVEIKADCIVPIIIDPDRANGDMNRTIEILQKYQLLKAKLEFLQNGFFKTNIQTLSSIRDAIEGEASNAPTDGFKYGIDGTTAGRFDEFLKYDNMSVATQAFMKSLFSKNNLEADLSVGFKGNPNMGSIVLNQFSTSNDFKDFASCVSENDKIFIISSIFGGTGAAGFPLLVKNLREGDKDLPNHDLLKRTAVGAITVMPYFNVMKNNSIDSNTFISKTKAALTYYQEHMIANDALNALYYIGDQTKAQVHPNDGGQGQANNAHYIEVLAATAILDFAGINTFSCTNEGKAVSPIFKEYGINKGDLPFNFKNLGRETNKLIAKPLVQYTYLLNYLQHHLQPAIDGKQVFTRGRVDKDFMSSVFFADLKTFNNHFKTWLEELERSTRSFKPMKWNVNKLMHNLVEGIVQQKITPKWGIFAKPEWSEVEFNDALNTAKVNMAELTKEQQFTAIFYQATETLYKQRIASQLDS